MDAKDIFEKIMSIGEIKAEIRGDFEYIHCRKTNGASISILINNGMECSDPLLKITNNNEKRKLSIGGTSIKLSHIKRVNITYDKKIEVKISDSYCY